jgi:hypothetical protein
MSNTIKPSFEMPTQAHADLLLELLTKAAAAGPSARILADLYEAAKLTRDSM